VSAKNREAIRRRPQIQPVRGVATTMSSLFFALFALVASSFRTRAALESSLFLPVRSFSQSFGQHRTTLLLDGVDLSRCDDKVEGRH